MFKWLHYYIGRVRPNNYNIARGPPQVITWYMDDPLYPNSCTHTLHFEFGLHSNSKIAPRLCSVTNVYGPLWQWLIFEIKIESIVIVPIHVILIIINIIVMCFKSFLHKITSILFRIILSFSKQAQPRRFLHRPWSLGLPLSCRWMLLWPVWRCLLLCCWLNHRDWTLATCTSLLCLWQWGWVVVQFNSKDPLPQVLSPHPTTPESILTTWMWGTK